MAKDKELADHERAHTGKPGSKVRHGADATSKVPRRFQDSRGNDKRDPAWGASWAGASGGAPQGAVPPNRGIQPLSTFGKAFMEGNNHPFDPRKAKQD